MPDRDPLAEALARVYQHTLLNFTYPGEPGPQTMRDADAIRAALDAAGYEVRPKLTAERLAAALHPHYGPGLCLSQDQHEWPGCDRKDEWYSDAAAILAIIDGEAT